MKRNLGWLAVAALAQTPSGTNGAKKQAPGGSAEAVLRGKAVFDKRCAVCHFAASEAKKIGPGLRGLNKRGTFRFIGNKVADEALKSWIENGDNLMPPFKEVLGAEEIKDLVRYVRTL